MHNCPKIPRVRCVQVSQKSASAVCAGTPPNSLRNELINYLWCLTSRKRQRPFSLSPPPQYRSLSGGLDQHGSHNLPWVSSHMPSQKLPRNLPPAIRWDQHPGRKSSKPKAVEDAAIMRYPRLPKTWTSSPPKRPPQSPRERLLFRGGGNGFSP